MFPQLEDEKIDAIADQVGALNLDEVYNAVESWLAQHEADDEAEFAQLSAEDTMEDVLEIVAEVAPMAATAFAQLEDEKVDAIADQVGELTVDEIAAELEGLFAQLHAEAETRRTGANVMHSMVDDAVDAYNMAYEYFPQLEADDVDAIADQIEALAQTTDLTSAALNAFTNYMEGDRRWGLAQTTDLTKIDPTKPNFCTGVNCYGDHSKLTPEQVHSCCAGY